MSYYLIYVSTADHLMTDGELLSILEESRAFNADHGITGMLIYVEGIFATSSNRNIKSSLTGKFMQILEGSKQEVEVIFDKIRIDSRHYNVILLESSLSGMRYFDKWQMGFKVLSSANLNENTGFFHPHEMLTVRNGSDASPPLNFLRSFYLRGQSQQTSFGHKGP